ncbi:hypothetical protein [Amycolatopsis cihanbeyliensis]|uniref:PE family protein n=1 Tax=Amycolatopsis cihanbeyliensis TaxID=1128664 RepID=A0A542DMF9_AMYCI|nr:hypothetical protein [Amycolatopsis cihanbeyliensis]TQJ04281.1 hypothetical protein FB471_4067 [Amycolatopsis cihanbeyliensis]
MASAGDEYLRSVLGGEDAGQVNVTGGGSTPGAAPEARHDIEDEIAEERADAQERLEEHREGGGGSWLDGINRVAASVGGGYLFDEETIAAKIREFENLRDQITEKYDELRQAAAACTPPSPDAPAVNQAKAAQESINKAAEHNKAMAEYAQSYIDALRKANGTYVEKEEDTAEVFKDRGEDGSSSGTGA